jgi:hypothetical protein
MQTLGISQKTIAQVPHLSGLFHAIALISCTMVFVVGCARTASWQNSLAGSGHESTRTYRSNNGLKGERLGSTRILTASWYGPGYEGKPTASGERFDSNRLTAASKTLPLGSVVRVTNLQNGRSVNVEVNDRGPGARSRSLDLSPAAADRIGLSGDGVARVKVTPVSKPLSETDLLKLLAGGVYRGRIATLVRERGINFKPTNRDLELLRAAGADDQLERTITTAHVGTS